MQMVGVSAVLTPHTSEIDSLCLLGCCGACFSVCFTTCGWRFCEKRLASIGRGLTLAVFAVVLICPTLVFATENGFDAYGWAEHALRGVRIIRGLCLHVDDVFPGGKRHISSDEWVAAFAFVGMYSYRSEPLARRVLPYGTRSRSWGIFNADQRTCLWPVYFSR